jgi:iron complex outermembrane receptor protein
MNTAPSLAKDGFGFCLPMGLVGLLVCATFGVPVVSQTPRDPSAGASESGEGLTEIVVTAQRRAESLQQTPISVSALTSQQLTDFGVKDFADYARSVPNMSFGMGGSPFGGPGYGYSSTRQIVIRGIAGADTTSLYIDDTPIPNVVDPRVFDLERIEVLRGPQGTLFGASSMGGTVRLITKTADLGATRGNVDLQAFDINAGGGGYDVSGSVNVPLVAHNAVLRLSVFDSFDPGYFTRVFGVANVPGVDFAPGTRVLGSTKVGDTHQYGGSASFLITPEAIPGLSIVPLVMLQRFDVNGYPLAEDNANNFTQVHPLNVPERSLAQWQFYAITAKYSASLGDLISSTSYFHRYSWDVEDGTMWFASYQGYYHSPLPYLAATVLQTYDSREVTEEIRFQSHLRAPVQFVAGVFYQRAPTSSPYSYPIPGLNAASGYTLGTDNIFEITQETLAKQTAGFAAITWSPIERVELSAGIRKTWLDDTGYQLLVQPPSLNANTSYSFEQKQRPVTPRFAAKYGFDSDDMAYVSASKGFRIGGVNAPEIGPCAVGASTLGLPVGVSIPYYSDSLWSYELGLKSFWDERKIASRAAAYYIDWKNIQQSVLLPVCGIPALLNAGAARIRGAEWELTARIAPRFEVDAGVGYEDARITEAKTLPNGHVLGFPVGTPLSGVPKWTASLRASYSIPTAIGDAFVRGEYSFVGSSLSLANGGAGLYRAGYSLVDLRGGLQFHDWTTTLFIKNLLNRAANYGDIVTATGVVPGQTRLVVAQPRTVGLELQWSFGAH